MTDLNSSAIPPALPAELSYEQALQELETIVAALEEDGRPLEESLALFERAQLLAHRCSQLLDEAELKVRQISGDELVEIHVSSER